jgi:rubrerythrin
MSRAAEFELRQLEEVEAAFAKVAERKGWYCKLCGESPMKSEFDSFYDNDFTCPHCQAHYDRFMRD